MSVEKSIDLTATGSSIEEAVVDNGEINYKVLLRISFVIKEQVHE